MTDKEVKVNQKFAKVISKIKETEDKLFALKDKLGKLYGEKGFTPELAKYLKDQKGIIIGKEKMTTTDKPNKNKFIKKTIKGIAIDVRSKSSLFITIGKWVIYIDNSTGEHIIESWID